MGLDATKELIQLFDFIYRAQVDENLTEYEYDRVFAYTSDEVPRPHPDEVDDWLYISSDELQKEMKLFPEWVKQKLFTRKH